MLRLLAKNKEVIVPIYGCSDGCCDSVFVKIKKYDQQVICEKNRKKYHIYIQKQRKFIKIIGHKSKDTNTYN